MPGRKGGRHKGHKVHFGWMHYRESKNGRGNYKQVKWKQGGGVRDVSYSIEESQTVESLLELGKKLFFPEGKSQMGTLGEMEIYLSQFDGTEISVFKDRNGNECSNQDYLKSNGMFSSQHCLYVRTKCVENRSEHPIEVNDLKQEVKQEILKNDTKDVNENETRESVTCALSQETGILLVNNQVPDNVRIKYTRYRQSVYGEHLTSISAYSMDACEKLFHENVDDANSIFEEFVPESIQVGDVLYLDKNENNFTFPQAHIQTCEYTILHGPAEICGTEDSGLSVIMGVITTKHGMAECTFTWMNNNECISTGPERCMVRINQPGSYNVIIEHNGVSYSFETPLIVSKSNRSEPLQSDLSNITDMVNLESQEAPQQLESLNKHTAFVSDTQKNENILDHERKTEKDHKSTPDRLERNKKALVCQETVSTDAFVVKETEKNEKLMESLNEKDHEENFYSKLYVAELIAPKKKVENQEVQVDLETDEPLCKKK